MVKLGFSLSVMAIGMIIVFTGLVILILAIIGVSKIIKAAAKKKETAAVKAVEAPAKEEISAEPEPEETDDSQLIAVITAAIMAIDGSSASSNLVVRSVKRSGSAWVRAGRSEILGSR